MYNGNGCNLIVNSELVVSELTLILNSPPEYESKHQLSYKDDFIVVILNY